MTLRTKIAVVAATLFLAGCQELPGYFASDTTLARAGGSELKMRDVESVVPKGVTGEDSAAFMKVYVDRWVRKQLKLIVTQTTAIDNVFGLFGNIRFMRLQVKLISTTTELVGGVVFYINTAIVRRTVVSTHPESIHIQFSQLISGTSDLLYRFPCSAGL